MKIKTVFMWLMLFLIGCTSTVVEEDDLAVRPGDINLLDYELMYKHHYALGPGGDGPDDDYNALLYCRVVGDTVIGDVPVYKYRFIKLRYESAETTMFYTHITDTSIVNYAARGTVPDLFLKARINGDSIDPGEVEVSQDTPFNVWNTPYYTMLFPFRNQATWLTRPEATEFSSTKQYLQEETINVDAGRFRCAVVHTQLLTSQNRPDHWVDQWWCGTVLVKSYFNMKRSTVTDSLGNVSGFVQPYETFELEDYRKLR